MAKGRATHHRGRKAARELVQELTGEDGRPLTDAELLRKLDGDQFRKAAQLSEGEMATLRRICSGQYVRNAAAIMNAIRMRVEYAYAKPAQGFDITVTDDREDPTDEEWEALTELRHKVRGRAGGADAP